MSEIKDTKITMLRNTTQNAVSELLSISEDKYGEIVSEQCERIAIEIGNMLAPQIYGNRAHGISNAVSVCIRHCSEALFWLDMAKEEPKSSIQAVNDLIKFLSSPML